MKRMWRMVGIAAVVAILGVAAVGTAAYAQEADDGHPFDYVQKFKEALAGALGISVEAYDAAVDQAQEQVVGEAVTGGWLTEDQAELLQWRMDQAPGAEMRGKGFGRMGPGPRGGNQLISITADELGMSLTDLLTELQAGKSIADVAAEKGVDVQAIADTYLAEIEEDLNEAVAEGRITQKQGDYRLEQAGERVTDQLNNTWEEGFRGGRRPGGMKDLSGLGES